MVFTEAVLDTKVIDVLWYSAETKDEPIVYAKVSSKTKKMVSANLTSSVEYKVATSVSDTNDTIVIIITE